MSNIVLYAIFVNSGTLVTVNCYSLLASVKYAPTKLLDRIGNNYALKARASSEYAIVNLGYAIGNLYLVEKHAVTESTLTYLVNTVGNGDTVKLLALTECPIADHSYAIGNIVLNLTAACRVSDNYRLILIEKNMVTSLSLVGLGFIILILAVYLNALKRITAAEG